MSPHLEAHERASLYDFVLRELAVTEQHLSKPQSAKREQETRPCRSEKLGDVGVRCDPGMDGPARATRRYLTDVEVECPRCFAVFYVSGLGYDVRQPCPDCGVPLLFVADAECVEGSWRGRMGVSVEGEQHA